MIAGPDSTPETMLDAVSHTLAALDAAAELDVDRSADDQAFFAAEKSALLPHFDTVFDANQAVDKHQLLVSTRLQVRVEIGDIVLDRGVRAGKARMKLELRKVGDPDGADRVFPSDIEDIVDAERRVEPSLVRQVVQAFPGVPSFPGKQDIASDLQKRADTQTKCFEERDKGAESEVTLQSALDTAIRNASTALYRLEKRLLERFPRDKRYVRTFFLDVAPIRKKRAANPSTGAAPSPPAATPETDPAADK